ncbi:hypothetical protein EJB05_49891, partial [Eragrostis curvula]
LRAAHPRLLAAPLAEVLVGAAALAAQACDLAAAVGAPTAFELIARLVRVLPSGSLAKKLRTPEKIRAVQARAGKRNWWEELPVFVKAHKMLSNAASTQWHSATAGCRGRTSSSS